MARKKTPVVTIPVKVEIREDDLIENILDNMSFEQIEAFIKKLDKECQDWGVTENLFKHFQKEMKKMPKDNAPCDIPFE